jgi:hypothetical protein
MWTSMVIRDIAQNLSQNAEYQQFRGSLTPPGRGGLYAPTESQQTKLGGHAAQGRKKPKRTLAENDANWRKGRDRRDQRVETAASYLSATSDDKTDLEPQLSARRMD